MKNLGVRAFGLFVASLLAGCGKSDGGNAASGNAQAQPAQNDPVLTLHWLGMKRLSAEPSAAGFLRIWRLPESERFKAQTLDKLALAPWHVRATNHIAIITNYAALVQQNHGASLLRPLLEDLVQDECYWEIRGNQVGAAQVGLAVHLDSKRASAWQTNLAAVFGLPSNPNSHLGTNLGWQTQFTNKVAGKPLTQQAQLVRIGDWTLVGLGAGQNAAYNELLDRAQRNQLSSPAAATKDWVQTTFNLRRLAKTLDWGWDLPEEWPRVTLNITGDGSNVVTGGKFAFSKPLQAPVEPWLIPTNLIHEPVQSLTAVQGIGGWLSSTRWWRDAHPGEPPNQAIWWAQNGSPFLDYCAAPIPNSGVMQKSGAAIMDAMNPMLSSNRMGRWERVSGSDAIVWTRAPIIQPFIGSIELASKRFVFAGVSPQAVTNTPPPSGTLTDLKSTQNAVYYDREITGPRVESWMFMSQLFRMILRREQLPDGARSVAWLKAAGPNLGPATTTLTKVSSTELALSRKSTVGLNSIELHLLADWLESPEFPFELFTVAMKMPPLRPRGAPGGGPR